MQHTYFSYTRLLILLVIILPGCQSSKQQPITFKKAETVIVQPEAALNYKEQKEVIKKKKQIKKKMQDELPSRIKDMGKEELVKGKEYCMELGYSDLVIKHLERLIVICEDTSDLKQYRLELADLYFESGEFDKAGKLYSQYLEYYPGSNQREYVEYKGILCRFYMTLQTDRDQTKTKETIALAHNYLEKNDIYTTYIQDVQQIQHASYSKLIESETEIVAFYLRRNKHKAAEHRLAHIKNNYLNHALEFEPDILKLEIQLASAQGYTGMAEQKKLELATMFTDQEKVQLTQNKKTDHVTKF